MSIRNVKKIQDLVPVKHAFISVYDKSQLVQLVEQLLSICPGLKIFSSGGTYTHLNKEMDLSTSKGRLFEASQYTGMPETDGGLVKTLHHKFFLGYLTETFSEAHQADLARESAVPIDLVVVDLYPFEKVISSSDVTAEVARGHIDVGGPSALRAAGKNFHRVMTVPDYTSEAYDSLIGEINAHHGHTTLSQRFRGFLKTFETLAAYDTKIAEYFRENVEYNDLSKLYEIV